MLIPKQFRNYSLGIKSIYIVAYNEILAFKTNFGFVLSALIQPVIYYLFIVFGVSNLVNTINYNGVKMLYSEYAGIGIFAVIIVSQTSISIYRATIDKRYGMLTLKLLSGVKPLYYIVGMSCYAFLSFLIQSIILFLLMFFTRVIFDIRLIFLCLVFCLIAVLFWSTLGIVLTIFIPNYQKRDFVIKLIITPLSFSAPAFYLLSNVPSFIKVLAYINPMTYQLNAIRSILNNSVSSLFNILIPILMTVILVIIGCILIKKSKLIHDHQN
jgi:ABC-2 type transport system permease protein